MTETPAILNATQMKQRYGSFYEASPKIRLTPDRVPKNVLPLLPYAEFWGIPDEVVRENLVDTAPPAVQQNLKAVVTAFEDALEEWLTGPDADNPNPTDEYVAFSALIMAADSV